MLKHTEFLDRSNRTQIYLKQKTINLTKYCATFDKGLQDALVRQSKRTLTNSQTFNKTTSLDG